MPEPVPGTVTIANDVLADIAGYAALEGYGIVGMASPSLRDGVAQLLLAGQAAQGRGAYRPTSEASPSISIVVVEYGTNLTEVSHNLPTAFRTCSRTRPRCKVDVGGARPGHQGPRRTRSTQCPTPLAARRRRPRHRRRSRSAWTRSTGSTCSRFRMATRAPTCHSRWMRS